MFPSEISGFVEQGGKNVWLYVQLSIVPIVILMGMTGLLVSNAVNLTTIYNSETDANIFSVLLSRLPYVIVASTIIGICFTEIMRINQQRLNLSKVNIIATDVASSSSNGLLNLSDEEIYNLRVKMKMDMLRDHLKTYLTHDFEPEKVSFDRSENSKNAEISNDESVPEQNNEAAK